MTSRVSEDMSEWLKKPGPIRIGGQIDQHPWALRETALLSLMTLSRVCILA